MFGGPSSLQFHSPLTGRVSFLLVGVEAHKCVSELRCRVVDTEALLGKGTTEYCSAGAVHWGVCFAMSPKTYCVSSQSTLLLALSSSLVSCGNAGFRPWCPLGTAFTKLPVRIHQFRSSEVWYQDQIITVWELWKQLRPWPSLHVHTPTQPTTSKARPVPALGTPIVYLDVPQVLSIKSWQPQPFS